jgi:hypothetical protein
VSGRPWAAGRPFKKVGGEAPQLFEGFPGRAGPPRPAKIRIFPINLAPPTCGTPMCRQMRYMAEMSGRSTEVEDMWVDVLQHSLVPHLLHWPLVVVYV